MKVINEDIWKKFTLLVIEKYGYRKKNQVIETLIKEFIEEHEWPITYNAIWAFEEDISELKRNFKEHVLKAPSESDSKRTRKQEQFTSTSKTRRHSLRKEKQEIILKTKNPMGNKEPRKLA